MALRRKSAPLFLEPDSPTIGELMRLPAGSVHWGTCASPEARVRAMRWTGARIAQYNRNAAKRGAPPWPVSISFTSVDAFEAHMPVYLLRATVSGAES